MSQMLESLDVDGGGVEESGKYPPCLVTLPYIRAQIIPFFVFRSQTEESPYERVLKVSQEVKLM